MGKNVRLELDDDGVRAMLTSPECQELVKEVGEQIYNSIPADIAADRKTNEPFYVTEEKLYKTRAVFKVLLNTDNKKINAKAQASNAKHNTLLKALNSVKGE